MSSNTSARLTFAAISVACVMLLSTAYFLQYGPGQQQPCPLCILQRYVYLAIAVVALLAAAVGPGRVVAMVCAGTLAGLAVTGAALASWQLSKGNSMANCQSDPVGQFVYNLPMRSWWPEFLAAYGGCADKWPPIFGFSIPLWSLIWFAGLAVICTLILLSRIRRTKY